MALNIRDPEGRRLARPLADATGETLTAAVIQALRERRERLRVRREVGRIERAARLMAHGERFAALPVLDWRSGDGLIDYDEVGLPR